MTAVQKLVSAETLSAKAGSVGSTAGCAERKETRRFVAGGEPK